MEYNAQTYAEILKDFQKNRSQLNDMTIEIVGGENNLDPIILLRAYEDEPTVDNTTALATQFCVNKTVRYFQNGNLIHEFTLLPSETLSEKFKDSPWLMDLLLKMCYTIMLKKLTPPSSDSKANVQP